MNKSKKYNIVDTYFYDYHSLEISIETSKIMLSSIELELNTASDSNDHGNVYLLKRKLEARRKLLDQQQKKLSEMKKIIKSFPNNFKDATYDIYYESIIKHKPATQVAIELGYSEQYVYKIRAQILNQFKNYLGITR